MSQENQARREKSLVTGEVLCLLDDDRHVLNGSWGEAVVFEHISSVDLENLQHGQGDEREESSLVAFLWHLGDQSPHELPIDQDAG
jgi:ATP-dependent 26S proteasome regulatory subunit